MVYKGSINLKIVLVIIIIIALIVVWIIYIIPEPPSIPQITPQTITKAKTELMNDITSGNKDIGITLPSVTKVPLGGGQDLEIILKNNESNPRCFMFDIELVAVDAAVSSGYFGSPDCMSPSCPGFSQIKQKTKGWFIITPDVMPADTQQIISSSVSFKVVDNAKAGRYGFVVFAYLLNPLLKPWECEPSLGGDQIDPNSPPYISSFQITIKP